jgi:hypothetical protein
LLNSFVTVAAVSNSAATAVADASAAVASGSVPYDNIRECGAFGLIGGEAADALQ